MASTGSVGSILNEAQMSLAMHKKCVKVMVLRRHAEQDRFLPELCNAVLPVLLEYKVRHAPRAAFPAAHASPRVLSPVRRTIAGPERLFGSGKTGEGTEGDPAPAERDDALKGPRARRTP
jgi:hypothetical protein